MGTFGSLPLFTQLEHVFAGPKQLVQRQMLRQIPGSKQTEFVVEHNVTTFAMPFKRDSINPKKRSYSPVCLKREPPLIVRALTSSAQTKVPLLNNEELYLINAKGQILLEHGVAITPVRGWNGVIKRDAKGAIRGEREHYKADDLNAIGSGILQANAKLLNRLRHLVGHPQLLVNPRFLLIALASGIFDTGIYVFGYKNGERSLLHRVAHVTDSVAHSEHVDRSILSNFLPIPLLSPKELQAQIESTRKPNLGKKSELRTALAAPSVVLPPLPTTVILPATLPNVNSQS